jgi:high-affinity nickel permease
MSTIKLLNILLSTINTIKNIANRLNNLHFTLKIILTLISLLLLISFTFLKKTYLYIINKGTRY